MITRKELSTIYWLNEDIKDWEKRLRELKEKRDALSINLDKSGVRGGAISDRTGNLAVSIAETERVIEGFLAQVQIKRNELYNHIVEIEDPILRQVVRFRCLDLMSWEQVGNTVGITGEAARKMFSRAYK